MIVLDTNVLSELVKGDDGEVRVIRWLRAVEEQPVTTVVNRAELMTGVALLPHGHRRTRLAAVINEALDELGSCLSMTPECADAYGTIVATRARAGRPIGTMDALIASIALVNGAGVATRDTGGFEGLGIRLLDPWLAPHG